MEPSGAGDLHRAGACIGGGGLGAVEDARGVGGQEAAFFKPAIAQAAAGDVVEPQGERLTQLGELREARYAV